MLAGESERWDALARYVAGESSPGEAVQVRQWLAEDPARQELLAALTRSIESVAQSPASDLDVEGALSRVKSRMQEPAVLSLDKARADRAERRVPAWRMTGFRVAAAITIVLGGTLIWQATRDSGAEPGLTAQSFSTSIGQTDTVSLADGSQVILAPDTRLTVTAGYNETERAVELTGEALFAVKHDANKPFNVRAGGALIQDLGTTFSVRSDAGRNVRVLVTEGSVRLQSASNTTEGIVLRAGDRGVLHDDGRAEAETTPVSAADLAWTEHKLAFEATPLEEVGRELHRWYGIELRIADAELRQRRLTTTFQGETRQQVLEIIALTVGARIEQRGDTAIVHALSGAPAR
jgi:transmembrane sensor